MFCKSKLLENLNDIRIYDINRNKYTVHMKIRDVSEQFRCIYFTVIKTEAANEEVGSAEVHITLDINTLEVYIAFMGFEDEYTGIGLGSQLLKSLESNILASIDEKKAVAAIKFSAKLEVDSDYGRRRRFFERNRYWVTNSKEALKVLSVR